MNGDESDNFGISETRNGRALEAFTHSMWDTCRANQVHTYSLEVKQWHIYTRRDECSQTYPRNAPHTDRTQDYKNMSYASNIARKSALRKGKPNPIQLTICMHTPHHKKNLKEYGHHRVKHRHLHARRCDDQNIPTRSLKKHVRFRFGNHIINEIIILTGAALGRTFAARIKIIAPPLALGGWVGEYLRPRGPIFIEYFKSYFWYSGPMVFSVLRVA